MKDSNHDSNYNGKNFQIESKDVSFIYENTYKNANLEPHLKDNLNGEELRESEKIDKLKVLKNINLKVKKGKFIALCGHTGCGKSTLVRTFNGLIPHFYNGLFYGYMKILGIDTITSSVADLSQNVGLVFQNPENQLVAMDVEKEIIYGLENRGLSKELISQRLENILEYLEIKHLRKRHPYELSGGEQQRVAIASILVLEPEIIILDEPTSALDPKAAQDVVKLLKKINLEKKITIMIIEHRLDMIIQYCDEIMLMRDGKIIENDSVSKVINSKNFQSAGIQIPKFISLFNNLKQKGVYKGDIPRNQYDAGKIIEEMLF